MPPLGAEAKTRTIRVIRTSSQKGPQVGGRSIEQYVALRLSQHSGKQVTIASCIHVNGKAAPDRDLYSITEHALLPGTWWHDRLKAPETRRPIGLFMDQFELIADDWATKGRETYAPPQAGENTAVDTTAEDDMLAHR